MVTDGQFWHTCHHIVEPGLKPGQWCDLSMWTSGINNNILSSKPIQIFGSLMITCLATSHRCKLTATYFSLLNISISLPRSIRKLWNCQKSTLRKSSLPTLLNLSESCTGPLGFSPTSEVLLFLIESGLLLFCLLCLVPQKYLPWFAFADFWLPLTFFSRDWLSLACELVEDTKESSRFPKHPGKIVELSGFSDGWWVGGQSQASALTECIAKFKKIEGSEPLDWLLCLLNIFSPSPTSGLSLDKKF